MLAGLQKLSAEVLVQDEPFVIRHMLSRANISPYNHHLSREVYNLNGNIGVRFTLHIASSHLNCKKMCSHYIYLQFENARYDKHYISLRSNC